MSVAVKTPTKTQYGTETFSVDKTPETTRNGKRNNNVNDKCDRRASFTRKPPFMKNEHRQQGGNQSASVRRRRNTVCGRPVLAHKPVDGFLNGGSIGDPLNLNSLCDEAVNLAMNKNTPVNSPLPLPQHRQQVHVLIPPNMKDPLNLEDPNTGDLESLLSPQGGKRKRSHKHKNHKRKGSAPEALDVAKVNSDGDTSQKTEESPSAKVSDYSRPMTIDITNETSPNFEAKVHRVVDKIVSPVVPKRISPKGRKRKRTTSDPSSSACKALLQTDDIQSPEGTSNVFVSPKPKIQKQNSNVSQSQHNASRRSRKQKKFIHGNYSRYYGYRNPSLDEDIRLSCLSKEWFEDSDVLDIGCNVGHLTLAIAKDFHPKKIVGVDIDPSLIHAARMNVRHYLSTTNTDTNFPKSLQVCYGVLAAPMGVTSNTDRGFPHNVSFKQANFVLETDELLDLVEEEYDVILGLSVTKWIHLNHGDEGLKRAFKRMFRQLRPGGKLILEPQPWPSYKKKKNLTETINKNYQKISLRPSHFTEYLMSREVGFTKCEVLDTPFHKAKGFRRPVLLYSKPDTKFSTPYYPTSPKYSPTASPCYSSLSSTPKFTVGSVNSTPAYDSECTSCRSDSESNVQSPAQSVQDASRQLLDCKSSSAPAILDSRLQNTNDRQGESRANV